MLNFSFDRVARPYFPARRKPYGRALPRLRWFKEFIQPRQTGRQNCACDNNLNQCRPLLALLWAVSAPFQSEVTAGGCERGLANL